MNIWQPAKLGSLIYIISMSSQILKKPDSQYAKMMAVADSNLQVQDPTLALIEPHYVLICPALQPVEVMLDGSTALWSVSQSSQFGIISELTEDTLCPLIQVSDEYVDQDWAKY
ncbi:hypothetical protein llap_2377 [Limosa lapponica baueri]|uniref:Uncharacterized protein n=1 Tax=Limosa lapponica baueri TaxID=1758121 RepID=A0A2I0UMM0_LIMLA|nr:hypothetical protein llap_2377 [Limosa lapponica baueri]